MRLNKTPRHKIANHILIASVHIPKTAGTSFRHSLMTIHGSDAVVRLDIHLETGAILVNEKAFQADVLAPKIKIVHGHFSPYLFENSFHHHEQLRYITWLRHPVDRVISNYYYLSRRLEEELNEKEKGLNILSKMKRHLMEYALDEVNRNRISKFLYNKSLDDFCFVGIVEYYASELNRLAELFNWTHLQVVQFNATPYDKIRPADDIRAKIAALNEDDMALYTAALERRQKRVGMLDLISIHIPKTGGTSFHNILYQIYGKDVSDMIRRRDYDRLLDKSDLSPLVNGYQVIHGHLYYSELRSLHERYHPKIICWVRNPIHRVIANYNFFIDRLKSGLQQSDTFALNVHRSDESLLTYAAIDENQNRMSKFLCGIDIDDIYFVGIFESFESEIQRLQKLLDWPKVDVPKLNQVNKNRVESITNDIVDQLAEWNKIDMALYQRILKLRSIE